MKTHLRAPPLRERTNRKPLRNVIEFVSNNQTVLIQLVFAKTLHGIDLSSFQKYCTAIKILLIVWSMGMQKCLTWHVVIILLVMGCIMAIMFIFMVLC